MDQPLTSTQLESIMKKIGVNVFKGVYSSDHLPPAVKFSKPWCLIANTDCSHNGGSHWTGMYFDKEGSGHYFDSYGTPPQKKEWIQYLEKNSKDGHWVMQRRQIQGEFTPYCGHYAAYYLLERHSKPLSVSDYKLMLHVNDSNIIKNISSKKKWQNQVGRGAFGDVILKAFEAGMIARKHPERYRAPSKRIAMVWVRNRKTGKRQRVRYVFHSGVAPSMGW